MPNSSIEIIEPMRPDPSDLTRRTDIVYSMLFYALILLAFSLQQLVQWSIGWDFHQFLLYDPGAALKADSLITSGLKPGVDFAYSYGLMSLDIAHFWFGLFGRTPFGYTSLTLVCSLLLALGIMHAALAMRFKTASLFLLLFLLPYAVQPYYLNQTHALEAALLIWAIGMQARGKLGTALALVTACLFIKPSMAYLYGYVLTLLIILQIIQSPGKRVRTFLTSFAPAGIVLVALAIYCTARYGHDSLLATLFPAAARKSYQLAHFGFFTTGKLFWAPDQPDGGIFRYYLLSEAGFWLLALGMTTAYLVIRPLLALSRRQRPNTAEITLWSIILLHLLFVLLLYAWTRSWTYYGYLLMLGIAGVADKLLDFLPPDPLREVSLKITRWAITALLALLATLGMASRLGMATSCWRDKQAYPETQGLRAYELQATGWGAVHQLLRQSHGLLLANGNAAAMFGDVRTPNTWFMSPGLQTKAEIADIRAQLQSSTIVVRYKELADQGYDPWNFPELKDLTSQFEDVTANFYQDNNQHAGAYLIMRRKQ